MWRLFHDRLGVVTQDFALPDDVHDEQGLAWRITRISGQALQQAQGKLQACPYEIPSLSTRSSYEPADGRARREAMSPLRTQPDLECWPGERRSRRNIIDRAGGARLSRWVARSMMFRLDLRSPGQHSRSG